LVTSGLTLFRAVITGDLLSILEAGPCLEMVMVDLLHRTEDMQNWTVANRQEDSFRNKVLKTKSVG
jgi:hypothetical protein